MIYCKDDYKLNDDGKVISVYDYSQGKELYPYKYDRCLDTFIKISGENTLNQIYIMEYKSTVSYF